MYYNKLSSAEKYIVGCIINEFDFNRVETAMKSINWTWHGKNTPSIKELKETAIDLISNCICSYTRTHEPLNMGTGGFTVEISDGANADNWYEHIILRFTLDEIDIDCTEFNVDVYNRSKKLDYINSGEYKKLLLD